MPRRSAVLDDDDDDASPTQAEMLLYYAEDDASPPRAAIVPKTLRSPANTSSRHLRSSSHFASTPNQPRLNPGVSRTGSSPSATMTPHSTRYGGNDSKTPPSTHAQSHHVDPGARIATPAASADHTHSHAHQGAVAQHQQAQQQQHQTQQQQYHSSVGRSPSRDMVRRDDLDAVRNALDEQYALNDELLGDMEAMRHELLAAQAEADELREAAARSSSLVELERVLEEERREHAFAIAILAKESADAVAAVQAEKRLLDAELRKRDVERAKLEIDLDIANRKIESLLAALDQERLASAGLATHYRGVLTSMVQVAPNNGVGGYQQQAIVPVRVTAPPDALTPPRSRAAGVASAMPSPDRHGEANNVNARPALSPHSSPPRVAGGVVGSRAPTTPPLPPQLAPSQQQQPAQRPVVRDKNEVSKGSSGGDAREVERLEQELYELSTERDQVDEQLRKVEHLRVRCIADKAKKDTLGRRLAELTAAVGVVRKRLRDLSALER